MVLTWVLGVLLGVLLAVGVIVSFCSLLFKAGEKEEKWRDGPFGL